MNVRSFGVAAVFLVGCAAGGATSHLAVPKASAQQAATLTRWEMHCIDVTVGDNAYGEVAATTASAGNRLGVEGWEPVGGNEGLWCWKRPKM